MNKDKLSDIEKIQYYKDRLKGRTGFWIAVSILMFIAGFLAARTYYLYYYFIR